MIDQLTSEMDGAIQNQYRVYCPEHSSRLSVDVVALCVIPPRRLSRIRVAPRKINHSVEYLPKYPFFSIADIDGDANLGPLLTKSDVWKHENEFRLAASEQLYFRMFRQPAAALFHCPKAPCIRNRGDANAAFRARGSPCTRQRFRVGVDLQVANLVPDRYAFSISLYSSDETLLGIVR